MKIVIDITKHNKDIIDRYVSGEGFAELPEPIITAVIDAVAKGRIYDTESQGCAHCKFNEYDDWLPGTNVCEKYYTHINPYSEGYCPGFERKEISNE